MRIRAHYGVDTGMYLVDVFLETPEERALDDDGVWQALNPILEEEKISPIAVVDFFRYIETADGKWISVYRNEAGELIP